MLCCGVCCKMSKRDYKVATTDGIELEPLGGPKMDKDNDGKKNGVKYGECFKRSLIIFCVSGKIHFVRTVWLKRKHRIYK